MISISLFSSCENNIYQVCIHINTWMIGKNSIEYHYQKKKKDFYGHLNMKDITYEDYTQKDFKTQNSDIMI